MSRSSSSYGRPIPSGGSMPSSSSAAAASARDRPPTTIVRTGLSRDEAALLQQMWQRLLSESEERTTKAITDLRGDVQAMSRTFMAVDRVQDRWKQDDQQFGRLDSRVAATETAVQTIQQALPKLATKDDIRQLIQDETKGFMSAEQVKEAIANARKAYFDQWRNWILIVVAILSLLIGANLIHLAALFGGK